MSQTPPRPHTTPVVGPHHKKSNSLVGFDPLLDNIMLKDSMFPMEYPVVVVRTASTEEVEDRDDYPESWCPSPNGLTRAFVLLGAEIEHTTPTGRKSRFGLQPAMASGKLHLPWKKPEHRKSESWNKESTSSVKKRPSNSLGEMRTFAVLSPNQFSNAVQTSSDMMQELRKPSPKGESTSGVQSLAKPRPTSFLTGSEFTRTSEQDASEWQLSIPDKSEFTTCAKLAQFIETYLSDECYLDLGLLTNMTRYDLSQYAAGNRRVDMLDPCHQPVVESLLESVYDMVQVRGHFRSRDFLVNPSDVCEAFVVERQHQLVCVFRGTLSQQNGKFGKHTDTATLSANDNVTVFSDRQKALSKLEGPLFSLMDRLTEKMPFCDIVFTGHSFGAALAILAAFRYAMGRPELRVAALVTSSPKVGLEDFRLSAHSLPNLKIMRLELGLAKPHSTSAGCHVGHTIRIRPNVISPRSPKNHGQNSHLVKAYRFGDVDDSKGISKLFQRDRDVADYVNALKDINHWVTDYKRMDGAGVRGADNEARQMS